ncbi:MAG: hypothetical protein WC822_07050 [Candidatus Paceibacterota bacterium]|jgi:hypothetical protein
MYKAQLRIPTNEQYAYIEITVEGTPEFIVDAYNEFTGMLKPKEGLTQAEFNKALDRYLKDGTGEVEVYVKMSPKQQHVFQEIKRSLKRIKAHGEQV